ncbi:MAG: polysaccharide deacetylase family protein [Thermoleophilia bacterium]|nr:polysaccharide deacetylase family protein [Thermoleophilia bacterium]
MRVALCLVVTALFVVPLALASPIGPDPIRRPHVVLQWEQTRALNAALRRGEPIYCGGGHANVVALTFDDGPGPFTEQLLELLRHAGAHATFFVVGSRLQDWPDAPHAESQVGVIGNHTWSHAHLTTMPTWLVWAELLRTQYETLQVLGWKPRLFRPPYEQHNAATDRVVRSLGLVQVMWSATSGDDLRHPTRRSVARNVIRELRPGAIVLMHDIHPWTIEAMPAILAAIRARGLRAVSIPELLVLDPPRPRQQCAFAPGLD